MPTRRKTAKALETMATRLVRKSRPAPPMMRVLTPLPRPIADGAQRRHQGNGDGHAREGGDAAASGGAADGHGAGESREQCDAEIEEIGIDARQDFSGNGVEGQQPDDEGGERNRQGNAGTSLAMALMARYRSPTASARPVAMMGPMSGEMSMAPMITAGLLMTRPKAAMPAEKTISSQ